MKTRASKPGPETAVYRTEGQVCAALREMFPLPAYALLPSVADATGFAKGRTIDALIMSCYPSRGLDLIGVEIKVSRSDWLRELKDPAKAEAVCRYCDRFYIAAGSPDIVKPDELPATWGLLEPKGNKLGYARVAPKLEPEAMPKSFLAAILRAASEGYQRGLHEEIHAAHMKGFHEGRAQAERVADGGEMKQTTQALEALRLTVKEFEEASGVRISGYVQGRKMGEAVKFIHDGGLKRTPRHIDDAEALARRMLEGVAEYRAAVEREGQAS